jgi:hypothetical protein
MPVLNVGERLCTPLGRIDLAADVIGAMVHPKDKTAMRRRRSAFAETLFAISDKDDEAEAMAQVKSWFRRAGGFKTASQADPYDKQQTVFLGQLPQILAAGTALHLVWAMDVHHRNQLAGGASLNKAIAIMLEYPVWPSNPSERTLRSAWSRYKLATPLCAAFTSAFREAFRVPPEQTHERLKIAYDQELHVTLSLAAAYQRFGVGFKPQGNKRPLLDLGEIWLLCGFEASGTLLPPPLPPEMLAVARRYRAH